MELLERFPISFHTVFDLYGNERLTEWRRIRNQIEQDVDPFQTVLSVWSRAPLVNSYIDSDRPDEWPDPWHLILDNRYDDLALTLGIMYTLKLTQRFMNEKFKIHKSMQGKENFYLVIDNKICFDIANRQLLTDKVVLDNPITLVYSSDT
jgi:hypothetical protein